MNLGYEEYKICKVRGHESNPMNGFTSYSIYNSPAFYVCKYCGTTFWTTTETTQHEKNAPTTKSTKNKENV